MGGTIDDCLKEVIFIKSNIQVFCREESACSRTPPTSTTLLHWEGKEAGRPYMPKSFSCSRSAASSHSTAHAHAADGCTDATCKKAVNAAAPRPLA